MTISECRETIKACAHSRTGQALNLVFLLGVIALTVAVSLFIFFPGHHHENQRALWYDVLQGSLDLFVLIEVLIRWTYYGRAFLRKWHNYLDLVIIVLCVAATVTEHIQGLRNQRVEDEFAMGCRISRDVIRILRLVLLMRWLSKSVVEFNHISETESEDGFLKAEGLDTEPLPITAADTSVRRGLFYDTPASSLENVTAFSPTLERTLHFTNLRRSDSIGDGPPVDYPKRPSWSEPRAESLGSSLLEGTPQDTALTP